MKLSAEDCKTCRLGSWVGFKAKVAKKSKLVGQKPQQFSGVVKSGDIGIEMNTAQKFR